jgi:hypothetical protein
MCVMLSGGAWSEADSACEGTENRQASIDDQVRA